MPEIASCTLLVAIRVNYNPDEFAPVIAPEGKAGLDDVAAFLEVVAIPSGAYSFTEATVYTADLAAAQLLDSTIGRCDGCGTFGVDRALQRPGEDFVLCDECREGVRQ